MVGGIFPVRRTAVFKLKKTATLQNGQAHAVLSLEAPHPQLKWKTHHGFNPICPSKSSVEVWRGWVVRFWKSCKLQMAPWKQAVLLYGTRYDLSWSGGSFPICFRPVPTLGTNSNRFPNSLHWLLRFEAGVFFCPKFQQPSRPTEANWKMCSCFFWLLRWELEDDVVKILGVVYIVVSLHHIDLSRHSGSLFCGYIPSHCASSYVEHCAKARDRN